MKKTTILLVLIWTAIAFAQVDYAVISIDAPRGFVVRDEYITPSATIRYYGAGPRPFWLYFFVRDSLANLIYEESVYVETIPGPPLPKMRFCNLGRYAVRCSLYCEEDTNSANDWLEDTFQVIGDIRIIILSVPRDTTDTLTNWRPRVRFSNYGSSPESIGAAMLFSDTLNIIYADTQYFWLDAGMQLVVPFYFIRFTTLGPHYGWLTLFRPYYDSIGWEFTVVPYIIGIAEEHLTPSAQPITPTIVRNVLKLEPAFGLRSSVFLLDITGRKVLDLKPGANDIRHLAPGVYFVREGTATTGVIVSKIVITH
ncbi:MAG: hypothetical protein ABIK42_05215 [candidate division WOR-3 bacterium]